MHYQVKKNEHLTCAFTCPKEHLTCPNCIQVFKNKRAPIMCIYIIYNISKKKTSDFYFSASTLVLMWTRWSKPWSWDECHETCWGPSSMWKWNLHQIWRLHALWQYTIIWRQHKNIHFTKNINFTRKIYTIYTLPEKYKRCIDNTRRENPPEHTINIKKFTRRFICIAAEVHVWHITL